MMRKYSFAFFDAPLGGDRVPGLVMSTPRGFIWQLYRETELATLSSKAMSAYCFEPVQPVRHDSRDLWLRNSKRGKLSLISDETLGRGASVSTQPISNTTERRFRNQEVACPAVANQAPRFFMS